MVEISYLWMVIFISILWILIRMICWIREKKIRSRRELALLLV